MKASLACLFLIFTLIACVTSPKGGRFHQRGTASWYGPGLHGNKTASGERFDMNKLTAAHRTLAFGTSVCVRSRVSKREVIVRINDRGPFANRRIIDLSKEAANRLGMLGRGEEEVDLYDSYCR